LSVVHYVGLAKIPSAAAQCVWQATVAGLTRIDGWISVPDSLPLPVQFVDFKQHLAAPCSTLRHLRDSSLPTTTNLFKIS